jgi:hypothetical protein
MRTLTTESFSPSTAGPLGLAYDQCRLDEAIVCDTFIMLLYVI